MHYRFFLRIFRLFGARLTGTEGEKSGANHFNEGANRPKGSLRRSPIHRATVPKTDKTVDTTDTAGPWNTNGRRWRYIRGGDGGEWRPTMKLWRRILESTRGRGERKGKKEIRAGCKGAKKKKKKEKSVHERGRKNEKKSRDRATRRKRGAELFVEKCHRAILIYSGREIGAANFVSAAETQKFLLVGIGTFIDVRGRFLARVK